MIALVSLPVLGYAMFYRYHKTKASVKRQRKREGQTFARMGEVLSAMSMVQAFGREKYEEEKFDDITSQTMQESLRLSRLSAAANNASSPARFRRNDAIRDAVHTELGIKPKPAPEVGT